MNWHWIFWLNVPWVSSPPSSAFRLDETYGPGRSTLAALPSPAPDCSALSGSINGNERGWTDPEILAAFAVGAALLLAFVAWEPRAAAPMLPPDIFRTAGSPRANGFAADVFGMFGSIFLLSQFFQVVQGLNPFEAGLRVLPWTAMPIFVAPIAGVAWTIGARPIIVPGWP